jgi:HPt (histidine-containing phosphotransfer) domain-containing protein
MSDVPMQAAIAAIWQKSLPQTRERLALLQRAADELSTSRTIDTDLRAEAIAVAHKMAGSLGMFGFHEATALASALEVTLEHPGLPQPERLVEQVAALSASLEKDLSAD